MCTILSQPSALIRYRLVQMAIKKQLDRNINININKHHNHIFYGGHVLQSLRVQYPERGTKAVLFLCLSSDTNL